MIVVVRGESYFRGDHDRNYDALAQYVRRGGLLFATSWVAWEMVHRPFAVVLPFRHLRDSHNEGVTVRARPAQSPLAQELFTEEFTFEITHEELSPLPDTTVLLHGDGGVPLYGVRPVGRGEIHYLNVCQHHCTRMMRSPLENHAFSRAMERVWRWLYTQCSASARRGASADA